MTTVAVINTDHLPTIIDGGLIWGRDYSIPNVKQAHVIGADNIRRITELDVPTEQVFGYIKYGECILCQDIGCNICTRSKGSDNVDTWHPDLPPVVAGRWEQHYRLKIPGTSTLTLPHRLILESTLRKHIQNIWIDPLETTIYIRGSFPLRTDEKLEDWCKARGITLTTTWYYHCDKCQDRTPLDTIVSIGSLWFCYECIEKNGRI